MSNRYIRTRYGTNGKSVLISFEIPGVRLELLQVEGQPTEAFGVMKGHCLENIITGAKKGIEIEIQRIACTSDRDKRVKDLEAALVCIDEAIARDEHRLARKFPVRGAIA
jgi:hypothetical protein